MRTIVATESDLTGLGRWNWFQVKGPAYSIFIFIAHQSIKSRTTVGTVYQQRERYFKQRNTHDCPRKLFINHLVDFISYMRAEGHEIILTVDINENSIDGRFNKALH